MFLSCSRKYISNRLNQLFPHGLDFRGWLRLCVCAMLAPWREPGSYHSSKRVSEVLAFPAREKCQDSRIQASLEALLGYSNTENCCTTSPGEFVIPEILQYCKFACVKQTGRKLSCAQCFLMGHFIRIGVVGVSWLVKRARISRVGYTSLTPPFSVPSTTSVS